MSGILHDFYLFCLLGFLLLNLELNYSTCYPGFHRDLPFLPSEFWDYTQLPCLSEFCIDPGNSNKGLHT